MLRRNLIYGLNQNQVATTVVPGSTTIKQQRNCGNGITISRARNVDAYHNTLDDIPHSAFQVGHEKFYRDPGADCAPHDYNPYIPCVYGEGAENVRIWNNVVTNVAARHASSATGTGVTEDMGGVIETWLENAAGLYADSNQYWGPGVAAQFRMRSRRDDAVVRAARSCGLARQSGQDGSSADGKPRFRPNPDVLGYRLDTGSPR